MDVTNRSIAGASLKWLTAAAFAALGGGALLAQVPDPQPAQPPANGDPALNADSFYGKEPTDGVYVRDSAAAVEKVALAQRMEHLKEWSKSSDLYQEVIVKYADRMVPSLLDKDKKICQYTTFTNPVQERLAHWPPEGLEVYRSRFETPAQTLLDSAGPNDAATLNKVYSLYFVTEAGKQAAIRLLDLYLENGEYSAAAWLGDRLLRLHPLLTVERASVLYRTAIAFYYAGDAASAKARLEQLVKNFGADRGVIRGKDVLLAQSLAEEVKNPVEKPQPASPDSWPEPWGDASRSRVSAAEGRPGAKIYSITLSRPNYSSVPQKEVVLKQYDEMVANGDTLGVMPVTDRGELFFQDGQRIYGVTIESGAALPGWSQTYPSGAYTLPGVVGSSRGAQLTLTLTDHEVLGVMGYPDPLMSANGVQPGGEPRMVCLDRQLGREKWVVSLSQLPDQAKDLRTLSLSGSPLVVGANVLVVAHGVKTQFEDCYVLAFDLGTGAFRWSTYIASASAGPMAWNGMPGIPRPSDDASHMAYSNGRVYVQTNLGALGALDAYTGAVVWLDLYPTGRQANERQAFNPFMQVNQASGPAHKPWTCNPVIVADGYVFSLPTEGGHLLIYDAASGAEYKRMDLKRIEQSVADDPQTSAPFDTLLGVSGDTLLLCSEKIIISLNWKAYSDDGFNPKRDNMTNWIESTAGPIRGRGFIAREVMYMPFGDRVSALKLSSGRTVEAFPKYPEKWELPEEVGNILATNDHVVVAGARSINVYTDLALAKNKLDRELALSPNDAQPRLKYAEIMFVAGEVDSATSKLDEAADLLGGIKAMALGANRERLFNDAMNFADKLSRSGRDEDRVKAVGLYDRAAMAANSSVQQVNYRMRRARFAEGGKDYAAAIALYQEILADPQLRSVPEASESSAAPVQADGAAERAIADIMKDHPAAYEPAQQAAAAALTDATANNDKPGGKLLEVARTFPNSRVAGKAMIGAAEAFENEGDPRHAIRVLRDLWFKHYEGAEQTTLQEAIARNYLALAALPREAMDDRGASDAAEAAAAALARATAGPGDPTLHRPLKLRDGTSIAAGETLSHALETLRKIRGAQASKGLPDMAIPLPVRGARPGGKGARPRPFLDANPATDVLDNVKTLVVPLRDFSRADRVVAFANDTVLKLIPAGDIKAVAEVRGLAEEPKGCAWLQNNLLIWGASTASLIDGNTAKVVWTADIRQMSAIDVVKIGDVAQLVPDAAAPDALVVNGGGRIIRNGQRVVFRPQIRAVNPVAPAPAAAAIKPAASGGEELVEVRPVGDHVLLTTTSGRIMSVDLPTGKVAWQTRLSDRPVDRMAVNDDFVVVRVSDANAVRLAAFDTATGEMRCTHSWVVQSGMCPINLALSADSTLVYTMPDRLCLKDLYKPWGDPTDKEIQATSASQGNQPLPLFEKATQSDQLLISEGRILALANNGVARYVRVHSLETGQPIPMRYHAPQGDLEVDRTLTAGKSDQVSLRVVGPHVYIVNPYSVTHYNLDRPIETWEAPFGASANDDPHSTIRDFFVGKNFAVLLHEPPVIEAPAAPVPVAPAPPVPGLVNPNAGAQVALDPGGAVSLVKEYTLEVVGRYPATDKNPAESGRTDFFPQKVTDPAGISPNWQACDGGFYYLTGDSKLHVLRGAAAAKQ